MQKAKFILQRDLVRPQYFLYATKNLSDDSFTVNVKCTRRKFVYIRRTTDSSIADRLFHRSAVNTCRHITIQFWDDLEKDKTSKH